jgi:hypothetical protein
MQTHTIDDPAEQLAEARNWINDAFGKRKRTDAQIRKVVNAGYPGGWDAFVAECCTYVMVGHGRG